MKRLVLTGTQPVAPVLPRTGTDWSMDRDRTDETSLIRSGSVLFNSCGWQDRTGLPSTNYAASTTVHHQGITSLDAEQHQDRFHVEGVHPSTFCRYRMNSK
jgi:hypothetical protein